MNTTQTGVAPLTAGPDATAELKSFVSGLETYHSALQTASVIRRSNPDEADAQKYNALMRLSGVANDYINASGATKEGEGHESHFYLPYASYEESHLISLILSQPDHDELIRAAQEGDYTVDQDLLTYLEEASEFIRQQDTDLPY